MSKFKEFTQIASNCGRVMKKYWFYKKHRHTYFSMKNITDEDIENIKNELSISFQYDKLTESTTEEFQDNKEVFINKLMVESFYNNNELFIKLSNNMKPHEIEEEFKQDFLFKTVNEYTDIFNEKEVIDSIKQMNDRTINMLVLTNAVMNESIYLFDIIEPYIDIKNNRKHIISIFSLAIARHGKKIKDTPIGVKILKLIHEENLSKELIDTYCSYKINNKKETNINVFLNMNIMNIIIQKNVNEFNIGKLTSKKAESLLLTINKDKDYNKKISQYLEEEYTLLDMKRKVQFLKKNHIYNNEMFKEIIDKATDKLLQRLFKEYKKIEPEISQENVEFILLKYKTHCLQHESQIDKQIDFINRYPHELEREEIVSLMKNSYQTYNKSNELELEARKIIEQKYKEELNIKPPDYDYNKSFVKYYINNEKKWLNTLYKKYPQHINNISSLIEYAQNSKKDFFLSIYLEKFFQDEKNEEYKKEIVDHLQIFISHTSIYPYTLKWIIDNNLLIKLIPPPDSETKNTINIFSDGMNRLNIWAPLLIEKYNVSPDTIIKQTIGGSNNELFTFILKNYPLLHDTQQEVANTVLATNNAILALEIFKKGIVLTNYDEERYKLFPTETGQILLKSRLKNKLENIEKTDVKKKVKKI